MTKRIVFFSSCSDILSGVSNYMRHLMQGDKISIKLHCSATITKIIALIDVKYVTLSEKSEPRAQHIRINSFYPDPLKEWKQL